jgi:hypothetical protein
MAYNSQQSYSYNDLAAGDFDKLDPNTQRNLRDNNNGIQGWALTQQLNSYRAPQPQQAAAPTPAPAPAPAPTAAAAPAAAAAPSPVAQQAMQGLQQSVQVKDQSAPAIGWADDPALAQTAEGLGTTLPSQAMGVLSQMTKRGIY